MIIINFGWKPIQYFINNLIKFIPNSYKNRISEVNKISTLIDRELNNENFELNLYHNMTVSDGIQSNNPWLQEMPDPISKVCWDNYISISPKDASKLNVKTDVGTMTTNLLSLQHNNESYVKKSRRINTNFYIYS